MTSAVKDSGYDKNFNNNRMLQHQCRPSYFNSLYYTSLRDYVFKTTNDTMVHIKNIRYTRLVKQTTRINKIFSQLTEMFNTH